MTGSVVPSATDVLVPTLGRLADEVLTIDSNSALPIRLLVDEPRTVGADRIVNTLAAREMYDRDIIAVDLGTATTYDCITAGGDFLGGVIAPGVSAGLEWLGRRTAKLPRVEFLALPPVDWLFSDIICYPDRLLKLIEKWNGNSSHNMLCTIKFQSGADYDIVRQFAAIPGSTLMHLFHNKHELTFVKPLWLLS